MSGVETITRKIARFGRPPFLRQLQPDFVRAFDLLVLALPLAALLVRLESATPPPVLTTFLFLLLGTLALAACYALARALRGPVDVLAAARELDRSTTSSELFVTASELEPRRPDSPFFPALIKRAELLLGELRGQRPRPPLRLPAIRRDLLVLVLTLLVLLAPMLLEGLLGPRRRSGPAAGRGEQGQGELAATAEVEAERKGERGRAPGLSGRLEIRAGSDRALYFLGEEIEFRVELEAHEDLQPQEIQIVLIVDGEVEMALPLPEGFGLPEVAGAISEARWNLRDRLRLIERYHRGITALDARVEPRDNEEPDAAVPANRVLIQIAENSEKVQAKRPTPVTKKPKPVPPKQQPKKNEERDQEKKPNEKNQPEKKPRPAPTGNEPELPPEDLPSKDYVVQPLFSGDQTTKRKIDVFDREIEDAAPESDRPRAGDPPRRRYERMAEAEMQKLGLGPRERSTVRRYLEALQPPAEKKER